MKPNMDKPTSEKDVIKELQKAHINNAYYIGRCGELEAKLDKVREYCEENYSIELAQILNLIK